MSTPMPVPQHAVQPVSLSQLLPGQTRTWADDISARVVDHYLAFRRAYYNEVNPSVDTPPPAHATIHQAEVAKLADSTLQLMPAALKAVPVLGGLLQHLRQVANIHSMSEHERSTLHNITMTLLHGLRGGIQPWYVSWLLDSARNLSTEEHDRYYMQFPWDALLYLDPAQLRTFESAVAQRDVSAIEQVLESRAEKLISALDDPIGTQPHLAFTGPDAERRRLVFRLKTSAALALGAYLVVEETRALLHHHETAAALHSALAPLPPELAAYMTSTRTSQDATAHTSA